MRRTTRSTWTSQSRARYRKVQYGSTRKPTAGNYGLRPWTKRTSSKYTRKCKQQISQSNKLIGQEFRIGDPHSIQVIQISGLHHHAFIHTTKTSGNLYSTTSVDMVGSNQDGRCLALPSHHIRRLLGNGPIPGWGDPHRPDPREHTQVQPTRVRAQTESLSTGHSRESASQYTHNINKCMRNGCPMTTQWRPQIKWDLNLA